MTASEIWIIHFNLKKQRYFLPLTIRSEYVADHAPSTVNNFNSFNPMFHFYTPKKHQQTFSFLTFLERIEMEHWAKMTFRTN